MFEQILKNMGIDPEAIKAQMENVLIIAQDMQARIVDIQARVTQLETQFNQTKGNENE